jgi:hypothetical protein
VESLCNRWRKKEIDESVVGIDYLFGSIYEFNMLEKLEVYRLFSLFSQIPDKTIFKRERIEHMRI